MKNYLKILLELSKIRITFAVMLTTIAGYLLAAGEFRMQMIAPVLGLFILACGSAAINQYQEHEKDLLMPRTAKRPIPSGRISATAVLLIGSFWSLSGLLLIYFGAGLLATSLGFLTMIWYNVIYTYLKKVSAMAVIPGSIIGSLPPLVGWVSAGGELFTVQAMVIGFFFFIWQVPHFWLLILKYGKEYEKAGFPSLTEKYSDKSIHIITLVWVVATAITALMLPAFHVVNTAGVGYGILLASIWVVAVFMKSMFVNQLNFKPMAAFMKINIYVLAIIIMLWVDALIQ